MTSYTTPHGLPVIEPEVDPIRSATGDNLWKQINAIALSTNSALASVEGRAKSYTDAQVIQAKTYADERDVAYREVDRALWRSEDQTILATSNLTAQILDVESSPYETIRNLIPNGGPYAAQPAWLSPYWGSGGAGTREFAESPDAASGRGYIRNTWTTSATDGNFSFSTPAGDAAPDRFYSGSITVRSSRETVLGAVLRFYDAAGAQVGSGYNRLYRVSANALALLEVNGFTSPPGTEFVRLSVSGNPERTPAPQAGDFLDVSAAIVAESDSAPAFFDGTTAGGYWDGPDPALAEAVKAAPSEPFAAPFTNAPAAAGPRAGTYSTSHRLYLPAGADLGPLRRRIAQALDGQSRLRLAAVGHSIIAGLGGIPGTIDNVRLFQHRASQAGKAVTGLVVANNETTPDSRLTLDPEWVDAGNARGDMQLHRFAAATGKSFTYTSENPGTVVDILTYGSGTNLLYSIDGGAIVTIPRNGQQAVQTTTITGLADTTHTVTVTTTSTATTFILGIGVRYETGLEVANFGYSGSIASDWTPGSIGGAFYNGYNALSGWGPDAVIVELGANEIIHGVGAANLETNLDTLVSALIEDGKDVVLIVDPPMYDASRTNWFKDFYPVIYDVADTNKVPLIDFTAHWINRPVADAQGFYADQWHPGVTGYYDLHSVLAKALLP